MGYGVEAHREDKEKGRAPPKEGAEDKINTCFNYFNSIILCLISLSFRPLFKILLQSSVADLLLSKSVLLLHNLLVHCV